MTSRQRASVTRREGSTGSHIACPDPTRSADQRGQHDEVATALIEQTKEQPGFLVHVFYEDGDGFAVAEVWKTQEQPDAWFAANVTPNVTPNVPFEITQVIDLHSAHTASPLLGEVGCQAQARNPTTRS